MNETNRIDWIALAGCLVACLAVGAISGIISGNSMDTYDNLILPALQPPGALFPIVWTILYLLMGLALYIILSERGESDMGALALFVTQLTLNFCWAPIFFVWSEYLLALVWIVILLIAIIATTYSFWKINHNAGYLMLPYIAWVTFATYLTYSVYVLN